MPVRIRIPAGSGKLPVILFSHGLGGSLDAGTIWAHGWAEAGFAVVNVQHRGSDSAIFGKPGFRSALGGDQLGDHAGGKSGFAGRGCGDWLFPSRGIYAHKKHY